MPRISQAQLRREAARIQARRKRSREAAERQFPNGTMVTGPFMLRRDNDGHFMRYEEGVGRVDWGKVRDYQVTHRAVPVTILDGDRLSGGYLPTELQAMSHREALAWMRSEAA